MMAHNSGKPYTLYRRDRVFYCRFKLQNGEWSPAKSTGETAKGRAEKWAVDYLHHGQVIMKENVTFNKFAENFFAWEGQWATLKKARGLRLSERWCHELNGILTRMILPAIGKRKLKDIDEQLIEQLTVDFYKQGLAGSYVNKMLIAIKAILTAAQKQKLIKYVPPIEKVENKTKEKGILTLGEVRRLFAVDWKDYRGYVASLLAASTGLRMGELQAVTLADINLEDSFIHIWRSWDNKYKRFNATTKTGKKRNIFIPDNVKQEIIKLIRFNPYEGNTGDVFLFFSNTSPERPAREKMFANTLYDALEKIGISGKDRRERNITFHSWRHFLNSYLINAKVPLLKIQSMTGHITTQMTEHYYHVDDMADVRSIQQTIFTESIN